MLPRMADPCKNRAKTRPRPGINISSEHIQLQNVKHTSGIHTTFVLEVVSTLGAIIFENHIINHDFLSVFK